MEHGGITQKQHFDEYAACLEPFGRTCFSSGRELLGIWTVDLTGFSGGKLLRREGLLYYCALENQLIENMHVMRVQLPTSIMPVRLAGE